MYEYISTVLVNRVSISSRYVNTLLRHHRPSSVQPDSRKTSVVYMLFCRYQHLSENVRKAKVKISPKSLLSINTN